MEESNIILMNETIITILCVLLAVIVLLPLLLLALFKLIEFFEEQEETNINDKLHCFQCEIEMPVRIKNNKAYCSNCGLYHGEAL
jgi:hypothetical protein